MRIGDYELAHALAPTAEGVRDFEATHVLLPRRARIRVLDHVGDAVGRRLMREACILEALRHPGVPRIYECGVLADRRPWIALELLDGPTLADAIAERPLLAAETLALVRDLAEILHHAHARGVVHCRLRPELVARHADGVCITGWGGAATHDARPHLDAADRQRYLAPELARGAPFEARADIYSLGVLAYEALAVAAPTVPLACRVAGLPRALCLLVDRMTSGTALARPSAAEVRAEATRLLELVEGPAVEDDLDAAIVEEIELELTDDLSRDPAPRPRRWTPPYRPTRNPGAPLDPLSDRRR